MIRLLGLFLALLVAFPAAAVELTATLKGTVVDTDGLPIPTVTLTLTSPEMLGSRTATTDADGGYRFASLPPGTYTLLAEKERFQSRSVQDFRLAVGTTLQLDLELLSAGQAAEEVVVYDTAPTVDVTATRTGAIIEEELLRDLPGIRDYQGAMSVTPGVVGGGNANMHGGFGSSNQFYIDGVNTTDPVTNTFNVNMNYDVIDSLQVITGGMDAEYGRSLGGVVNIVTKSGGNTYEGTANLIYQAPGWWLAKREDFDPPEDSDVRNTSQQLALTLGGPIVKDKLWFFGAFQGDRYVTQTAVPEDIDRDLDRFPMVPRDWRSIFWFAKLTAQPVEEHRVWLHFQGDPTWIDNVAQDPYTLPMAEQFQYQGGWLGSLGHLWTPGENVTLETQLYYQPSILHFHSQLWREICDEFDPDDRRCLEDLSGETYLGEPVGEQWFEITGDGFNAGEFPWSELARRYRASFNTALTVYGELLGEHTFKTGIQAERLSSRDYYPGQEINGEQYYAFTGTDPNDLSQYAPVDKAIYESNWDITLGGNLVSYYLQDVYQPHPRLTLRPGLRFDYTSLSAPIGEPAVLSMLNTAPRMGVAYDLTGDGLTSAFFYYGRFYDAAFLSIGDLLKRAEGFGYGYYPWDAEAGDWAEEPYYEVGDSFLRPGDLRSPYSDELNLGFRQGFGTAWAASATLIYEEAHRFWEDDEVNLIWNDDGTDVIGGRNGTFDPIYRLRTPDSSFTQYTSVELTLERAFSKNWTTITSYTWSRAYGTNSADQATALLDIPEQRSYEIGLLDYDVPHAFKTAGAWSNANLYGFGRIRSGFTLGWNLQVQSGTPYRRLAFNDYYGGYYNYARRDGDGRHRLPAFSQLDLRALTNWRLDRQGDSDPTLSAGVEVFNVLNTRTVTSVQTYGARFGKPLDYQSRRSFQIVARGTF